MAIMEKLSIREASEKFGISRARLYQLLDKGAIVGHQSAMRGRSAKSWVDGNSLSCYSIFFLSTGHFFSCHLAELTRDSTRGINLELSKY